MGRLRTLLEKKPAWRAVLIAVFLLQIWAAPRDAHAVGLGCEYPVCEPLYLIADEILLPVDTQGTETLMDTAFKGEETYMKADFFDLNVRQGMQDMASQLTATGIQQMMAIGGFIDAIEQLQTQRLFQQKTAQAHKDYQTSTEMCAIGTVANGLGAAYQNGQTTAILLARHSHDRQLFAQSTSSNQGQDQDLAGRLTQFKNRYCDPHDNNLSAVCQTGAASTSVNKDIDFTSTVYLPLTINADFTDGNLSGDEQDVLALDENLYAHALFPKVSQAQLNQPGNQAYILDWRSVVAKRSVAENSYNALVGMKAADATASAANAKYLDVVLQQLGASKTDAATLIGPQPSYYARMELLTKKIYEAPEFYTALYDTPANVARKGAALRAIDLMQHMDLFNSQLRNEAMLAELVELDVTREQSRVQNNINRLVPGATQ